MKAALLMGSAVLGAWFWSKPAVPRRAAWPDGMPVFAAGRAECSYALRNGTSFVCASVSFGREEALARARSAFRDAGWQEMPVRTGDMVVFVRGDAVAALVAESLEKETRLTAIQRPAGL